MWSLLYTIWRILHVWRRLHTFITSLKRPPTVVQCSAACVCVWCCTCLLATAVPFPPSGCGHRGCTGWGGEGSPPDSASPSNAGSHLEMGWQWTGILHCGMGTCVRVQVSNTIANTCKKGWHGHYHVGYVLARVGVYVHVWLWVCMHELWKWEGKVLVVYHVRAQM